MRGNPVPKRILNPISIPPTKHALFLSSSPFSSSSGSSGRGGGRGGGSDSVRRQFDFNGRAPGKSASDDSKSDSSEQPPSGIGHGRGKPIPSAFTSFISSLKPSQSATGRGRGTTEPGLNRPTESQRDSVPPKTQFTQLDEPNLPSSIQSALSGMGRGKPDKPDAPPSPQVKEENRHIRVHPRPKPKTVPSGEELDQAKARVQPKFSREEAVRRAVSILSQGEGEGRRDGLGRGRGGDRGGRGRGRRRWEQRGGREESEEGFATGLFLGNNADGEKLAEKVGVENMNKLIEGFEEVSGRVLPSPMEDAYLDALHTNYMIEFEPEYLMGEFDQNPDIDEKLPMPLRDVLEKVKPFIMAYEGIQSHEEWEEIVEETMKNVPLLKEIVDYYSGPDRVTAKKQQEELERVAKTIPVSAPASVKQFADRAVLSLQSNPGWGFDRKCQFMDKLVREVNQCYD